MHRIFSAAVSLLQKRRYACISLILIHCILIGFAFHRHIASPKDTLLAAREDGLKNYFTWSPMSGNQLEKKGCLSITPLAIPTATMYFRPTTLLCFPSPSVGSVITSTTSPITRSLSLISSSSVILSSPGCSSFLYSKDYWAIGCLPGSWPCSSLDQFPDHPHFQQ